MRCNLPICAGADLTLMGENRMSHARIWLFVFFLCLFLSEISIGQSRMPPCSKEGPVSSWDSCEGAQGYPGGDQYVGEFRDGRPNGQGARTAANGNKYVGEFKDGKPNGQGTATSAGGDKLIGEFRDGKLNGLGSYTFDNGNKYVGEFKDSQPGGQGTMTYASGNKYVGEFKDGKRHAHGTYFFMNGDRYIGQYKAGKRDGQGTLFAADGSIISSGIWADGKILSEIADTIKMEESAGVYFVCSSSDNLRLIRHFEKGGSGSSGVRV